ncbi:NEDD8-conjugating enzyme UBE2F isoform X2 [Nematostella vectensis]|uniref:NEDD8-conjugating enzyme UBE2F isoform X2 n=1 Tax=Nematostella vectensis TaxID=45351 RepID=UPI0020770E96|nr:NEDD8-conjugating enzyme UBE2F isoform X2 [Nematostella vectensis]
MITLSKKIKEERERKEKGRSSSDTRKGQKISIRDALLTKEAQEMEENIPDTCQITFKDPDKLYDFYLTVVPDEGFWKDGIFKFHIMIPEEYNIKPPYVNCSTKIWHPNISESGEVCLSLLREHTLDGSGWAPTRHLKDLLNFEDPLNVEASQMFEKNKDSFKRKVDDYIRMYASSRR